MQNPLSSLKVQDEKYLGIYRGVIEDNNDPDKMGRCKIRVFSVHGSRRTEDNKSGIETEHLPGAFPGLSLFEGGIGGFGCWTIPHNGSHVYVFFEGGNKNQVRYFASAPGLLEQDQYDALKSATNEGFKDPNIDGPGVQTEKGTPGLLNEQYPYPHRVGEPDGHKLSRDSDINEKTLVNHKNAQLVEEIIKAKNKGKGDEPRSYYLNDTDPKYPNNNVLASSNGIVLEIDNSKKPRLHLFHPSNSYLEIDEKGNMVFRINEDRFDITLQDHNEYIKLDHNITIDRDKTQLIGKNEYFEVLGDRGIEIHKSEEKLIHENKNLIVDGDENEEIKNDRITKILNKYALDVGVDRTALIRNNDFSTVFNNRVVEIRNNEYLDVLGFREVNINGSDTVNISGDCDITVSGNCNITVSGNCNIQASMIMLNS